MSYLDSIIIAADPVDLNGGWDSFIGVFDQSGGIRAVASVVGFAVMIFFFIKWIWDKRRGSGGGFPIFPMLLGAILAAPGALIPLVLLVLGWIITLLANIVEAIANTGGA